MTQLPRWASNRDLIAYYENHRARPEDLYASEARFLPWLAERVDSVLDVGCAAGGFHAIWRHYAPAIRYEGVDLSPGLVAAARRLHPDVAFHEGDVLGGLDLPDEHADVVQALGWLHWVDDLETALAELWRLAGRFLFFDVRITEEHVAGRQRIELLGEWDGETETPYVTVAWEELVGLLSGLEPTAVYGTGYWGPPSSSAVGVPDRVCLAAFVVERGDADTPSVALDLPFSWPEDALPGATVLPADAVPGDRSARIGR